MSREPEPGGSGGDGGRPGDDDSFAEVMNRFTFDSGRSRRRRRRAPEPPPEQQAPSQEPFQDWPAPQQDRGWLGDQPGPGQSGPDQPGPGQPSPGQPVPGHPGPGQQVPEQTGRPQPPGEDQFRAPQPPPQEPPHPQQEPPRSAWQPPPRQDEQPEEAAAASIRPYAWTGGRTKTNYQFEMETLVSTSEWYRPNAMLRGEHQSIVEMCRHPRSVAEVSALLSVPLGVAKVLLADMAELGLITVHQTVTESGSAPHLNLMERVLSGLRRL